MEVLGLNMFVIETFPLMRFIIISCDVFWAGAAVVQTFNLFKTIT
jgi:hypothetical protein